LRRILKTGNRFFDRDAGGPTMPEIGVDYL